METGSSHRSYTALIASSSNSGKSLMNSLRLVAAMTFREVCGECARSMSLLKVSRR